jgi:hypothetical protein
MVWNFGFRVECFGFVGQGLGFGKGKRFRVWELGVRVRV